MRYNLGCGNDIEQGYINVDTRNADGVDLVHDISLGMPCGEGDADEIFAQDILEHFSFRVTETMLCQWFRALKPGGTLTVQVPNIDKHIRDYWSDRQDKRYKNGYDDAMEFLRANIFGGQDYEGNYHKTCFTPNTLKMLLHKVGFKVTDFVTHDRAIIAVCQK